MSYVCTLRKLIFYFKKEKSSVLEHFKLNHFIGSKIDIKSRLLKFATVPCVIAKYVRSVH